jgi:hypothetical protein
MNCSFLVPNFSLAGNSNISKPLNPKCLLQPFCSSVRIVLGVGEYRRKLLVHEGQ